MAAGEVITTGIEVEQPLLSVTVAVWFPAGRLLTVAVVCPVLQLYVYGVAPALATTVAVPFVPPLQVTFVEAVRFNVGPLLLLTATVVFAVQLLLSETVNMYVPAGMLLIERPLLTGDVFHCVENGPVPPLITTVALPLLLPQVAAVLEVAKLIAVGWVMVKLAVAEHPATSVTVAE